MTFDFRSLCIRSSDSIRNAMACINNSDAKIALVLDGDGTLLDTITDGDVRRAILAGVDLNSSVDVLRGRRAGSPYPEPVTAPFDSKSSVLLKLMRQHGIRQIPLLDADRRVKGLVTLNELLAGEVLPLRAVVMAGGFGKRLMPLTEDVPKPMLPVGNKPLLELIIRQLRKAGVRKIYVTTHYRSEQISSHFKDGREFGVDIRYLHETEPMGTAGALSLLEKTEDTVLVINGDILTRIDYRAMLDFHRDHGADLTIAVRPYEFQIPFGVIDSDGITVTGVTEKPLIRRLINAGIYLLAPNVLECVPAGRRYDMTDLIEQVLSSKRHLIGFPLHEFWLDIGQYSDYEKALVEIELFDQT